MVSEYVRKLIREEHKRSAKSGLEQMLLDGLNSGPPIKVNEEYWQRKRTKLLKNSRPAKPGR